MNKIIGLILAVLLIASPVFAVQLKTGNTNKGQFHTLQVVGAEDSLVNGGVAVVDFRSITQSNTTGAVAALTLDQDDVDQPILAFECTEGSDTTNTCSHYATTTATKAGTLKVTINGTTRYIPFYAQPN
jgi:hypothetical protein